MWLYRIQCRWNGKNSAKKDRFANLQTNFIWSVLGIHYLDCNFTDGFGGWENLGQHDWIIVNSTVKNVESLTGKQGTFPLNIKTHIT